MREREAMKDTKRMARALNAESRQWIATLFADRSRMMPPDLADTFVQARIGRWRWKHRTEVELTRYGKAIARLLADPGDEFSPLSNE